MAGSAVLVHPLWGGPCDWDLVAVLLRESGVDVLIADLPTHSDPSADRADDVEHVQQLIDRAGESPVVVGWSYGCAVVNDLDFGADRVAHLVYLVTLPAFLPSGPQPPPPPGRDPADLVFGDDGTFVVDEAAFLGDPMARTRDAEAFELLQANPRRPMSFSAFMAPPVREAWKSIPTTVVLGRQDHQTTPERLAWAEEHFADVRVVDTQHDIGVRDPGIVASIVIGLLEAA